MLGVNGKLVHPANLDNASAAPATVNESIICYMPLCIHGKARRGSRITHKPGDRPEEISGIAGNMPYVCSLRDTSINAIARVRGKLNENNPITGCRLIFWYNCTRIFDNIQAPVIVTATRTAQTTDETLASSASSVPIELQAAHKIYCVVPGLNIANSGGQANKHPFFCVARSGSRFGSDHGIKAGSVTSGTTSFENLPIDQMIVSKSFVVIARA